MPTKTNLSSNLLVLEFTKSNKRAFRKLYELYWEAMYVKAISIVENEIIAKDIVQEIWIKLWQKREAIEIQNFEAYIHTAVRNNCYKYLRDKKFSSVRLEFIEKSYILSESASKKQHDLEETLSTIKQAMNSLPKRCKQIFELSRFKHYSNEEIAMELGISKKSVENQISVAVKSIRSNLTILLIFIFS